MDVVKEWADMVHCRPVDLGNAFVRRLKLLEETIRNDERQNQKRPLHPDLHRQIREADAAFAKLQTYLMKVATHENRGNGIDEWAINTIECLRRKL